MRDTIQEMEDMLSRTLDATDFRELAVSADGIPPMQIHLEDSRVDFSGGHPIVERIDAWLRAHDFDWIGDFAIEELGYEQLRVFLSRDRCLVASIRQLPEAPEPYVEFCFDLGDRQRGGVSNPPNSTLQLPSDAIGRFHAGQLSENFDLLNQMWLEAVELVEAHEVHPVDRQRIAEFFEEAHAAEMEFRIAHGGVSAEEIRYSLAAQGVEPTSADIEHVQQQWQESIENYLLDFSSRGMNHHVGGGEILIVHDGSLPDYLIRRIQGMLEQKEIDEDPGAEDMLQWIVELRSLLDRFSPREAMARFRPLLPQSMRYHLVDQMSHPLEADLYSLHG